MNIVNEQFTFFAYDSIDNPNDCNIDVSITLPNGRKYVATFITVQNVRTLMNKWKETGEYNGKYFWCPDMFIIESLDRDTIEHSILEVLKMGEFEMIFKELEVVK
jgi:hypothetical protein